jgi:hypothetical protein
VVLWCKTPNLVMARRRIQQVRVRCRRAIIILLHAHVALDEAVASVDADELVGVIAVPCCFHHAKQATLRQSYVSSPCRVIRAHGIYCK